MSRSVDVIIVCEDQQQDSFVRRYLAKRGFHKKRFRVRKYPGGQGSGEQFVREQFVLEVEQYRQKSSYSSGGVILIATIDADSYTVSERIEQLNGHLEAQNLVRIQPDEQIAVFVPKRNIETWLEYAHDQTVDEDTVYPKRRQPGSCQQEVDLYVNDICPGGISANAPSSLRHACRELERIL